MNRFSSRWIDLARYYTKEILLKVLTEHMNLIYVNKKETQYTFLCPFHKEKTPSFKIYQNKEGWWGFKCFGCGKAGNVFTFLVLFLKVPFWEVLVYFKKRYYYFFSLKVSASQLPIPFPVDEKGAFVWVSVEMRQLGFS